LDVPNTSAVTKGFIDTTKREKKEEVLEEEKSEVKGAEKNAKK
jgi:hypothetical protein